MEFIEMFDGNIPSLLVIAVIMLASQLINNGYLSKLLKGKGKSEGKSILDLVNEINGKITAQGEEISRVSRRLGYVDKSALMGNIYNPAIPVTDRLTAFDCYLRLGGNGLVAEFAINELVFPNWNDWLRARQKNCMDIYCDKYEARIAEINNIFRGRV
ncbi:MAG: hypothetical protein FWC64_07070 [Treponema sp.]|nr:hypothetical protein [Treponema sp.]